MADAKKFESAETLQETMQDAQALSAQTETETEILSPAPERNMQEDDLPNKKKPARSKKRIVRVVVALVLVVAIVGGLVWGGMKFSAAKRMAAK